MQQTTQERKRLRLPQVMDKVGWKRATIYKKVKEGEFPAPSKDGRTSYWWNYEIDQWLENRINST